MTQTNWPPENPGRFNDRTGEITGQWRGKHDGDAGDLGRLGEAVEGEA